MSEKLNYQLVGAKETFHDDDFIPERSLVFEGPGFHEEASFPKYSTVLIFDGEIYDWFGRKIKKGAHIAEPICYLGTSIGQERSLEWFIVRSTRKCLSLAFVQYDWNRTFEIKEEIGNLPHHKQIWRTFRNLNKDMYAELYYSDYYSLRFNNFILPTSASRPPILDVIDPQKELFVIPECWIKGDRKETFPFFFNLETGASTPYGPVFGGDLLYDVTHIIYRTRNDIFEYGDPLLRDSQLEYDIEISPDETLNRYTDLGKYSAKMAAKIREAEYEINRNRRKAQKNKIRFMDKLSFSENGKKMYTKFACGRCVTDMEVMQKASSRDSATNKYFYWYLA